MKEVFLILLIIQITTFIITIETDELKYYYKDYIKSQGYKLEEHEIITEDGYFLNLWHIVQNLPVDKNKIIFIQPGFMCSAWVFFQLGKNSLPFLLIEKGYDVWIANNRGTLFSLEHISKNSEELNSDYWDFSMDENVLYDLPTNIDYIKEVTGAKKINFIGHSQGTTIFYMLYMHNPSYVESSINKYISLGTVPNIAHTTFLPIQMLDKVYGLLEIAQPLTKAIIFNEKQRKLLSNICKNKPNLCKKAFEAAASLTPTNKIKYETIYPFLYYYPAGTSSDTMLHWSQIHQSKKLVYFNPEYSSNKELKEYDISVLKNWKIKAFIQRSDCDTFSSYDDVTDLYNTIKNKSYIQLLDTPLYGHTDALCSESAINDIYIPLFNFLEEE